MPDDDQFELLPPNATPLERAFDRAGHERIDKLPVELRTLYRPWEMPAEFLPWMAWQLSVDRWDPDWPDDQKRRAIDNIMALHRERGTVASVKRALASAGFGDVKIIEHTQVIQRWRETGGAFIDGSFDLDGTKALGTGAVDVPRMTRSWAEYVLDLDVLNGDLTLEGQRQLREAARRNAPVRSKLAGILFRLRAQWDARIWLSPLALRLALTYAGCGGMQVHRPRLLLGCHPIGGSYAARTLDGRVLDGDWPITGQRPVAQRHLDQGWGTAALHMRQTTRHGMAPRGLSGWTLGEQLPARVLDGRWRLNEQLDAHRPIAGHWHLDVATLGRREHPRLNAARRLGPVRPDAHTTATAARAVGRDRHLREEIRLDPCFGGGDPWLFRPRPMQPPTLKAPATWRAQAIFGYRARIRVTGLAAPPRRDAAWRLGEARDQTINGRWRLNERIDAHRRLDGGWRLGIAALSWPLRPTLNGARDLGGGDAPRTITTRARGYIRDRRKVEETRL